MSGVESRLITVTGAGWMMYARAAPKRVLIRSTQAGFATRQALLVSCPAVALRVIA